jgi:hypothetical protein
MCGGFGAMADPGRRFSLIDRKILAKVGFCVFFGRIMVAYSLFFQLS